MDMGLSKLHETVKDREAWSAAVRGSRRVRHDLVIEQQEPYILGDPLLKTMSFPNEFS